MHLDILDQIFQVSWISILLNPDLYAPSLDFLPEEIELYPAYPNPFNPTVKIPFDLNQENVVSLSIFDLQGKKVKDLISSKRMKSGKYIMNGMVHYLQVVCIFIQSIQVNFFKLKK